jgi:hypothetical protein
MFLHGITERDCEQLDIRLRVYFRTGHRAAAADEAPGPCLNDPVCLMSPPGRVPTREVQ